MTTRTSIVATLSLLAAACGPKQSSTTGAGETTAPPPDFTGPVTAIDPGFPDEPFRDKRPAPTDPRPFQLPAIKRFQIILRDPQSRECDGAPPVLTHSPGDVASVLNFLDVVAEEVDGRFAAVGDVERIAARGRQTQHHPGGYFGAGVALGGGGETAAGPLLGLEPIGAAFDGGGGLCGGGGQGEKRQEEKRGDPAAAQGAPEWRGRGRRTRRAPLPFEALAEADEHPHHRRPGDQRQDHVADHMRDLERDCPSLENEEVPQR